MDDQYKHAHRQAEDIKNRIIDLTDDKDHSQAKELLKKAHELMDNLKVKINPRTIEDRIKATIRLIEEIRHEGEAVMNFSDLDYFRKEYEKLQMSMRQFSNY